MHLSLAEEFNNAEGAVKAGPVLHRMILDVQRNYPDLVIGGTGNLLYAYDMIESSKKDFGLTAVISLLLIQQYLQDRLTRCLLLKSNVHFQ